jgi:hypothetical protein
MGGVQEGSLRPHEDSVARKRRAWGNRRAPGVFGFCALLGIHAVVVPAVSSTDHGQGRIRRNYLRRIFLCGLQGHAPHSLADVNAQLRQRIASLANQRVHGTTREQVAVRRMWNSSTCSPSLVARAIPSVDGELRKVARDAYVDWQGSRIQCPGSMSARECGCMKLAGEVDVLNGRARIAVDILARLKHEMVTFPPHHQGTARAILKCACWSSPPRESRAMRLSI